MDLQEQIPYVKTCSPHPTVWVEAELDLGLPPVGVSADGLEIDLLDQVKHDRRVPVTFLPTMPIESQDRSPILLQVGKLHKRSLDIPKPLLAGVVDDVSIKGVVLEDPALWTCPNYIAPYNDIEGGMVYRDAAAAHLGSSLMHERGIDFGERILGVAVLKTMPTSDGVKPTDEALRTYRDRLFPGIRRFAFKGSDMQPVAVVRSMPNSYRLWDISKATLSYRGVYALLERSLRITAQQVPDLVSGLDPTDHQNLRIYLSEHVPYMIGYAYGRLRGAGLRQKYPNAGNMSLSLSLPDSDGIVMAEVFNTHTTFGADSCVKAVVAGMRQLTRSHADESELWFTKKARNKVDGLFMDGYRLGKKGKHPSEL